MMRDTESVTSIHHKETRVVREKVNPSLSDGNAFEWPLHNF